MRKTRGMTNYKGLRPLVDADSFIYGAGFSADYEMIKKFMENLGVDRDKAEELAAEEDYLVPALGNLKQLCQSAVANFDKYAGQFYLTGSGNYREQIATIAPYKGNRPDRKPKYYKELRDYIQGVWGAEVIEGMEADDAVSIEQWANKDKSTIIVSIDKDLNNTPGWHYNPRKDEIYYISLHEADWNFWKQVAVGDTVDNVKGLHRVGAKTVEKAVNESGNDLDQYISWLRRMYDKQYGADGPHALHENATLLWIQRKPWINYDGSPLREGDGKEESSQESCD